MQKAVPLGEGGMIAILGLSISELNDLLIKNTSNDICEIANDNANGQIIVSGDKEGINKFSNILKEKKTVQIHCGGKVSIITNLPTYMRVDSTHISVISYTSQILPELF